MRTQRDRLAERLGQLQLSSAQVETSAVVSADGLIIASALPPQVDEDRLAAMSAAMLSLGDRMMTELSRGQLQQVYIRGSAGLIILMAVGPQAVLTVMAHPQAKIGLLLFDVSRAADDLARLLAERP
ncbi:MAG: roadblock/LC7 domain-containing protein [Chloroflexota bacterium]